MTIIQNKFRMLIALTAFILTCGSQILAQSMDNDPLQNAGGQEFNSTIQLLQQYYPTPIDWDKAMRGAIKGLLDTLNDQQTYYSAPPLPPETTDVKTSGPPYYGFGLALTAVSSSGGAKIETVYPDGAAAKGGLLPGDVIISIDDVYLLNQSLVQTVLSIRGEKDTTSNVTVQRGSQTFTVTLTRAPVTIVSVTTTILPGNIGHLGITTMYTAQTADIVKKAIAQFQEKGIKSLILDLRDCGGGLLNQATQITDLFVSGGPLLRTRGQDGEVTTMATAQAQNTDYQGRLIILVNRNTGAGAELIAGALQDLKRAVVIGERTAAVGMMTQSFPVGDAEASVVISVGELLRPSGMPIQGKGITPDVVVHDTRWDNPLLTGTHFPPGAMINMTYNGKSVEFKADESGAVSHITLREQGNPVSSVASNAMVVNSDAILKAAIAQLK